MKGKGYLSTQKTSASSQFATMCIRGAGFSADDIHQYQVGEDALAVIRSQVAEVMTGHQSDKLISYLKGLFGVGQKMSGIDGDHKLLLRGCYYGCLRKTNYLDASSTVMDAKVVTTARHYLRERAGSMTVMAVHPDVAYDLEVLGCAR